MFQTEQRAKRKAIKDKRCRQQRTSSPRWPSSYQSSASIHSSFSNSLAGYLPVLRDFGNFHGLSPCFKIAIKFISSFVWNFHQIFISYVFWFACIAFTTKAIIQYSLWFVVSGSHFAYSSKCRMCKFGLAVIFLKQIYYLKGMLYKHLSNSLSS